VRRLIPLALVAAVLAAPQARAIARTWTAGNGSWNTAGNWTPNGVPTAADDLTINTAVIVSINNGGNGLANSLTITAGVTINRAGGRVMTVTGGIAVNTSGNITITAPFTCASLTKDGSGTLTLMGAGLSSAQEVSGAVDVLGGTLALAGANALNTGGAVTVETGATLSRAGGGTVNPGGLLTVNGTMSFANAGGLVASAAGVTVNSGGTLSFAAGGGLTSTGTVTVNGGALSFGGAGGLTATGQAVTVTGGGSLSFSGTGDLSAGSFNLTSGSTLGLFFNNGTTVTTLTLTDAATLTGTVNIGGANPNTVSSPFTIVTSTNGPVSVSGVSLGAATTGFAFGFRPSGNNILLDVTSNPIVPDATGSATGSCGSPLTWQHTITSTGNDRYLLVGVSTGNAGGSVAPTSVTFGSQVLNLLASATNGGAGSSRAFIYGIVAPTRGTGTITVTLPAGPCSAVGGSLSYTGVNQTTSTGTAVGAGGTGTTASATVSTIQGDKVISVLSSNAAPTATPQAGATVRWAGTQGTELGTGSTVARSGAGTVNITMSWTLSPSSEWALAAIPIRASAATRAGSDAASLRWSPEGAAVSIRSSAGSDLVGFRVWRESAGRRELLTPGLIAGPALISRAALMAGSESGWVDRQPLAGATYLVESLHLDGSIRWTPATPSSGKAPVLASLVLGESPPVTVDAPALRTGPADLPINSPLFGARQLQWQLADSAAAKIFVSQSGVVRVSAESLFSAGIPVGTPVAALQLYRNARQVPRSVIAADGATLRAGDWVEFFGYPMDTRYSGLAVYWLTTGMGSGVDLSAAANAPEEVGTATYQAAVEIRERLTWFAGARNGDAEKFFGPAVHTQALTRTLTLDALDVLGGPVRLEVALQGVTDVPHTVQLSVNGTAVGTLSFDGAVPGTTSIQLPPGMVVPGDNVVALMAPSPGDLSLEQYIRIVYPRQTVRGTGPLDFTVPGGAATRLDGFDPALTRVLDITDPGAPVRLATWNVSGAAAVSAPGGGTRHLLAYLPSDVIAPVSVRANVPSSWHSADGAELVIMGPRVFFPAVQALVDRRQAEGLTVALIDIEDVWDEFAFGEKSVDAVQALLTQGLKAWALPPRFLLLLGSATYDPRNYLGYGGDLVPSAIVQTEAQEAASDSWFVAIPGADSLSVGRLPVRTPDQAQAVVAKILGRQQADGRSPVLLVSDAVGTSDFPEMTADVRATLPNAQATVLIRSADGGSTGDDLLHQQFIDAARTGPALVNYTGHASEFFWSGDIHTVQDIPQLAGGGTSLWIDMTCLTGLFQDALNQSLSVATLLTPSGGAWGAWASSSQTYPAEHSAVNRALVSALLLDGKTLGEATRAALAGVTDPDVASTFVLLGDPSARAVATTSSALTVSTKSSASSGCSTTQTGSGTFVLLGALALWFATQRRRDARFHD